MLNEKLTHFLNIFEKIEIEDVRNFCITSSELKFIYNVDLFEDLLIQGVSRNVNNKDIYFLGIKNIVLKKEYQSLNIFTKLIEILEIRKIPVFIDDIINYRLFSFFYNRGYINLKYNSPYGWKRCMYKLDY